jgi:hypothetical protein
VVAGFLGIVGFVYFSATNPLFFVPDFLQQPLGHPTPYKRITSTLPDFLVSFKNSAIKNRNFF